MGSVWNFQKVDSTKQSTVIKLKISVLPDLKPFNQQIPDYNQTVIKFEYLNQNGLILFNSVSGLVENEKNTWMHPPRDKLFRILELNPFPFVKAPFKIGTKWNWQLLAGDSWGDLRWTTWKGQLENNCHYEIIDKRMVNTNLGKIECYEILAKAENRLGSSKLNALYNLKYGFVELDFTNIDGSKTKFLLQEFRIPNVH